MLPKPLCILTKPQDHEARLLELESRISQLQALDLLDAHVRQAVQQV
jgi:hypothetical protein